MSIIKHLGGIILLTIGVPMLQVYAQPDNLVLQDTTIATAAIFAARNSITAGPNFTIAKTGEATFATGGYIYFKPGIVIIHGGKLRTGSGSILMDVRTPGSAIPAKFNLQQNYPNPFNPTTTINFDVPRMSKVRLVVYNLHGQEVRKLLDNPCQPGQHTVVWDGQDNYGKQVSSGVYFIQMHAGEFMTTLKALLVR